MLAIGTPYAVYGDDCANPPAKVFALRHAETDDSVPDRPLSREGQHRANALVDIIGSAPISAIYTTELRRTKETARPLAESQKIGSMEIKKGQEYDLCARLCSIHSSNLIVVVGHSDTIPTILRCLGSNNTVTAGYGDLFEVTFLGGNVSIVKTRFGE